MSKPQHTHEALVHGPATARRTPLDRSINPNAARLRLALKIVLALVVAVLVLTYARR